MDDSSEWDSFLDLDRFRVRGGRPLLSELFRDEVVSIDLGIEEDDERRLRLSVFLGCVFGGVVLIGEFSALLRCEEYEEEDSDDERRVRR